MDPSDVTGLADTDLLVDVHGLTVVSVVTWGREVLAMTRGGAGWWIADGERYELDGDDGQWIEECEIHVNLQHMRRRHFAAYVARLERWRDEATPLRFVYPYPPQPGVLIESADIWAPVPNRPMS